MFHFNKASIGNPGIPPWIVKSRGATHYVQHLVSTVGFSTKETPDNPHTQGSIQFRGRLDIRDVDGAPWAFISEDL